MKQREWLILLSCCLVLVACSETPAPVQPTVPAPVPVSAVPIAPVPFSSLKTSTPSTAAPKPAVKKDSASKAVKKVPAQETIQKTQRVLSVETIVS
jgi:PBP1b-binding outer membrane lipoprotein LpoB